jgi:hypothetical protein
MGRPTSTTPTKVRVLNATGASLISARLLAVAGVELWVLPANASETDSDEHLLSRG